MVRFIFQEEDTNEIMGNGLEQRKWWQRKLKRDRCSSPGMSNRVTFMLFVNAA